MVVPEGEQERYTHGYHRVIIGSYQRRTAEVCAAFLLPSLGSDAQVLDLGCGPGTITVGLARCAGRVIGIDASPDMVKQAAETAAEHGVDNAEFKVGSAYELPFESDSFDVVYAHQVMQHLRDPVRALTEVRRVLRPGGRVALRDSDYGTMVHSPVEPAITHWLRLYHNVARANKGEPHAGRFLPSWAHAAGFVNAIVTSSTTTYADPESRQLWGGMWAVRVTDSDFASHAVHGGFAMRSDLTAISAAFQRWTAHPAGFWAYLNTEVLATKP